MPFSTASALAGSPCRMSSRLRRRESSVTGRARDAASTAPAIPRSTILMHELLKFAKRSRSWNIAGANLNPVAL
eukprot:9102587-Alexandrium_andersonii.AAC.1